MTNTCPMCMQHKDLLCSLHDGRFAKQGIPKRSPAKIRSIKPQVFKLKDWPGFTKPVV